MKDPIHLNYFTKTKFLYLCYNKPYEAYKYLAQFGELAGIQTEEGNLYLISNQKLMLEMLKNIEDFVRGMDPKSPYSNGLFTADGERWKALRNFSKPKFKQSSILTLSYAIESAVDNRYQTWHQHLGGQLDVTQEMMTLTLEIFIGTMFKMDARKEADQFIAIWRDLISQTAANAITPELLLNNQVTPDNSAQGQFDEMEAIIKTILQKRSGQADDYDDLFQGIIDGAHETCDSAEEIERQIITQVLTFLIASHETTSASMTWLFYLLDMHPAIEQKMVQEIMAHADKPFQFSDYPYVLAVVKEVLRLYPPAWYVSRYVPVETTLGDYTIPGNSRVDVSILDIHRDESIWPQPFMFRPERFVDRKPKVTEYLPFGAGARRCIGDHLALLEMVMMTVLAYKQFKFEGVNTSNIEPAQMVLRASENFIVKLKKR